VERSSGLLAEARNDDAAGPRGPDQLPFQEQVRCLWPGHQSIFYYDKERLDEYQEREERDLRGERKLDSIIDVMEMKWERMDRYWFQKHRHLDQKMRKKKDDPSFAPPST